MCCHFHFPCQHWNSLKRCTHALQRQWWWANSHATAAYTRSQPSGHYWWSLVWNLILFVVYTIYIHRIDKRNVKILQTIHLRDAFWKWINTTTTITTTSSNQPPLMFVRRDSAHLERSAQWLTTPRISSTHGMSIDPHKNVSHRIWSSYYADGKKESVNRFSWHFRRLVNKDQLLIQIHTYNFLLGRCVSAHRNSVCTC